MKPRTLTLALLAVWLAATVLMTVKHGWEGAVCALGALFLPVFYCAARANAKASRK